MEERLFAEDHRRQHATQTPQIQRIVVALKFKLIKCNFLNCLPDSQPTTRDPKNYHNIDL
jgi:hypothetical protein